MAVLARLRMPVPDTQDKHDYTYVFDGNIMSDICGNNSSRDVRDQHNL